jgi:glycosyltransferase involved in cell wall biosynthesis
VRIAVVTDIPSPYQVELFDELGLLPGWTVTIIYIRRSAKERSWDTRPISHEHLFLAEESDALLARIIIDCDLAVFSGYRPSRVARLMRLRSQSGKAWAFWGERPGLHFPGWLGRQYRRWALRDLRSSRAAVWGIGQWAVEGYRQELGTTRPFFNLPYFSRLGPFLQIKRRFDVDQPCRFLFSGSFIHRKGVDVLVAAFSRLVADKIDAELHLLGAGPLQKELQAKYVAFQNKVQIYGFRQWHELCTVYALADVLCVPSRYDGWGLVVPEGLAAGMPVISTDCTGAARELINCKNGWIVPAGNRDAFYDALKLAATLGAEQRRMMSEQARQAALTQDIEAGVQRFFSAATKTVEHWHG